MKKKKTIILVIIIIVGIGILASFSGEFQNEVEKTIKNEIAQKYAMIEEPKLIEEGNKYFKTKYIVGTIKNNSGKKTNLISITFNLYDKDGNVIGSAMDNINFIDVDGTWKFKAVILEDEFDHFKLGEIIGF